MKYDADKVYYYNVEKDKFYQVMDFSVNPGDTIVSYCRQQDDTSIISIVDSISYLVVGGDTLRVQHFSDMFPQDCYISRGVFIERIGPLGFMFPQHAWADPPYGGSLRCYEDSIIGLYHVNNSVECDYLNHIDGLPEYAVGFSVFPNPASNWISIVSDKEVVAVIVEDMVGKIVIRREKETGVDVSNLNPGIYFLTLLNESGAISSKKIVVN